MLADNFWREHPTVERVWMTSDGIAHATEAGASAQQNHVGGEVTEVVRPEAEAITKGKDGTTKR